MNRGKYDRVCLTGNVICSMFTPPRHVGTTTTFIGRVNYTCLIPDAPPPPPPPHTHTLWLRQVNNASNDLYLTNS